MTDRPQYPKRLIEVDLPIKRISKHARREKFIRHGHISTLHIWWARRPLGACRAVLCASLWPDPADELCPQEFREAAVDALEEFAQAVDRHTEVANLVAEDFSKWMGIARGDLVLDAHDDDHLNIIRHLLLDFIAAFAAWEASTQDDFLSTARKLTDAAHKALGGGQGTRPLVVDPFAGGGSIPLEGLRIGADAFASDLNPVAVLLNRVILEYIPRYGSTEITMHNAEGEEVKFDGLAEAVRYWGNWVNEKAKSELEEFYEIERTDATPLAYLWARTIVCEGPGCGAEIPLLRSLWLSRKKGNRVALKLTADDNAERIGFKIVEDPDEVKSGTVSRGKATCPICGFTTPVKSVRRQLSERHGGADDARMFAIVTTHEGETGRNYQLPNDADIAAAMRAADEVERRQSVDTGAAGMIPDESLPPSGTLGFRVQKYGILSWCDLFSARQLLALSTLTRTIREFGTHDNDARQGGLFQALVTLLALAVSRQADYTSSLCTWHSNGEKVNHTFGRQALPMTWDFTEVFPFSDSTGCFTGAVEWIARVVENNSDVSSAGKTALADARTNPLPDQSATCVFTDPPYYDAVPYADLSQFFIVWLRRMVGDIHSELAVGPDAYKGKETIVDESKGKTQAYYKQGMADAFAEGRRVLAPDGIGSVIFAHKSTEGWEALLEAVLEAGWVITASWPIDTEMGSRLRAMGSAALASSVHLVFRPRENADGTLRTEEVGDWREVMDQLPSRVRTWLPRLTSEGVVGADAIFACLGPALEIFSQYSRVERANGEVVTLPEYLEHVWSVVSHEALSMIFESADASGFEEDARLTAMWLWTLTTGDSTNGNGNGEVIESKGYELEFDTARKIAQGLGAHLEQLPSVIEVKGETGRLLPVRERAPYLFKELDAEADGQTDREPTQRTLFDILDEVDRQDEGWERSFTALGGETTLDRVHQAMLLFTSGRQAALKRFLTEDGHGKSDRFWRLAQALSALYPRNTDEKRWVDGVLSQKKGLGL